MNIHIIENPTGTYSYVGVVPFDLIYDAKGITPEEYRACMAFHIAKGLAEKRGGYLKTRTFATREAAAAYATKRGYAVA